MADAEQLKAFNTFKYNVHNILAAFRLFDETVANVNASKIPTLDLDYKDGVRGIKEAETVADHDQFMREAAKAATALGEYLILKEVTSNQINWFVVMLVTATEAYLQDALAEAASVDSSFIEKSQQTISYSEANTFESIEDLMHEFRMNWAKHFIDNGGPSSWVRRLSKMGARGYSAGLSEVLEQAWGVRHLIVHRTGKPDRAFSRRHSAVPCGQSGRIAIDGELLTKYALAMVEFAGMTDRYLNARCAKSDSNEN